MNNLEGLAARGNVFISIASSVIFARCRASTLATCCFGCRPTRRGHDGNPGEASLRPRWRHAARCLLTPQKARVGLAVLYTAGETCEVIQDNTTMFAMRVWWPRSRGTTGPAGPLHASFLSFSCLFCFCKECIDTCLTSAVRVINKCPATKNMFA